MKARRPTTVGGSLRVLLGALLFSVPLLLPFAALAVTPAGTLINCVTTVTCTLPRNVFKFGSNPVAVTVLQVHNVAIDGAGPVEVKPGKTVSLPHVIRNTGNVPDSFALEAMGRPEVEIRLFAADGVTPLTDTDGDGRVDTSIIPGGGKRDVVVKMTAPINVKPGDVETVTLKATSAGGGPGVTATIQDLAKIADFWAPLLKTVFPAGQAIQGTLLTYSCSFASDVSVPATHVLISDPLDKNLEFLEGSATLPPGIPGASTSFDPATRTVSWKVPAVPAGYVGSVSFQARVRSGTASDTDIFNTFHMVSDQNPEPQFSKAMKTPVVEQPLRVIKTVNRTEAEIGDFLSYTVSVENVGKGLSARSVEVIDILPKGFRYARGSSALDNVPIPDPSPATSVRWSIGDLEPGKRKVLTYRTLVSVDAPRGDGVNYATAAGKSPAGNNLVSPSAAAMVRVVEGVLNDKSIVLGRVFVDLNRDLMPDADEPGMGGVRLYLDNGYYAVTDPEGKFSIVGIDPGDHVLKLDRTTLPPGFEPEVLDSTFAGDAGSRFIRVPFGGPARGDFALREVKPQAPHKPKESGVPPAQEKVYTFNTTGDTGPPSLEEQIAGMPDSPEILEPAKGALLRNAWTNIVVRVPDGAEYGVSVNGNPVPEKQIGKTIVETRRKIRIAEFVGVKLDGGANRIELEVTDTDGVAHRREIEVMVPGEPVRLEVRSAESDVPADGKTVVPFTVSFLDKDGREAGGDVVYTVRAGKTEIVEPDVDGAKPGHQLKAVDGRGTFHLRSGMRTGAERIEVTAGTLKGATEVFFTPQMRDWVVAGVGSVTAAQNSVSGKSRDVTRDDSFESGLDVDGRLAFFAKGTVLDRYLVTAAYDSEKEERKELFQRIPPDRYYPIFGDASLQGYEAESRKKYYAKIEKDRSYLLVGDFNTYLSTNEFTRYDRSFNGVKADIETRNATLRAFGTSTDHASNREEIQGNGTSGYYFLGNRPIVENSDKIRIEVRDRYHTERVVAFAEKTPYADYTLDYRTGALLFREPVPSYDANLNPVRIVVLYESEAPGTGNHIYGARGGLRADQGSQAGVTAVVEETGRSNNTLFGADAAWKIDDKSVLRAEAAQSHSVQQGDGTAFKTELGARFRDALVDAYYRRVDRNFRNLSMTGNETGTEKYGAKLTYPIDEGTKIVAEAFHHADVVNATTLSNASLGVSHRIDRFTLDTALKYLSGDDDRGRATTAPMALAGVSAKISERLEGSILQEQAFTSRTVKDYPTRTLLKLNYKLSERTSAFVTDEIRESGSNSGNNAVMGISTKLYDNVILTTSYRETAGTTPDRQVGTEVTSKWEPLKELTFTTKGGYQLQDSMTGSRGQALLGVDTSWEALKGLRIGAKAERVQLVTGRNDPAGINTSFALSAAWFGSEKIKATGRYEFRSSHEETAHLSTAGGALKVSESLSLLGKATFWVSDKPAGSDLLFDGEAGAAYRPLGRNSLYLLGMLRFKDDSKDSTPDREKRKSLTGSVELSDRLRPNLTLHGKYAGKLAWDSLYGREVSGYTDMIIAGATYDLSARWDVDLSGKIMNQYDTGMTSIAAMPEVGYRIVKNVRVAAGYNFAKLNDRDLSGEEYGSQGPYVQLKFKFDERTIEEIYLGIVGKPRAEPPPQTPAPVVALVQAEVVEEPVQVVGSLEGLKLLVNDREAELQHADARLETGSDDDVIEVKGGEPDPQLRFEVEASDPDRISSWTLAVTSASAGAVRSVSGKGAPPSPVLAELRDDRGEALKGGEIYRYRIEVAYADGARVTSPFRLFGLQRASSVAVTVNVGAFKPGSATLSRKARLMLKDAASALRKHPKEKVVVEGHADSTETDPELSRRRSEAAAAYLVNEERIPASSVLVRWCGSAKPLASNAIAEGRDINRRVEIKGEYSDLKRPAIVDRRREQPSVALGGEAFAVDEMGRFTGSLRGNEKERRVEMGNADGRSVSAVLTLPQVTLAQPLSDGAPVLCPGEDVRADGRLKTKIRYRFAGTAAPGGTLSINGETIAVAEDGAYSFTLELPQGQSSYWMQARDARGYGREFSLKVAVTLPGLTGPSDRTGRTAKGNPLP